MSGDNLLGEQPMNFYSTEMSETKIKLVHHYLRFIYQSNSTTDLDRKHKEWGQDIAS